MPRMQPGRAPVHFTWTPADPFAAEHARLGEVLDAMPAREWNYREALSPDGAAVAGEIAAHSPDAAARYVRALVARLAHYDRAAREARDRMEDETERMNWHFSPAWKVIWPRRMVAWELLKAPLRRKLPLGDAGLSELAGWIAADDGVHDVLHPVKTVARLIQARAGVGPLPEPLREATARLSDTLRNRAHDKHLRLLGDQLEKVTAPPAPAVGWNAPSDGTSGADAAGALPSPAEPAPAGSPRILVQLKRQLGMPCVPEDVPSEVVGLDRFPLRADSPLREEHGLITGLFPKVVGQVRYSDPALELLDAPVETDRRLRGRLALAAAERVVAAVLSRTDLSDHRLWQSQHAVKRLFSRLMVGDCEFDRDGLFDAMLFLSAVRDLNWVVDGAFLPRVVAYAAQSAAAAALTAGERHVLHRLRTNLIGAPPLGEPNDRVVEFTRVIGDRPFLALVPGEAWSDAVNADLVRLPAADQRAWLAVFRHTLTATGARPSAKWLKAGEQLLKPLGRTRFAESVIAWLGRVDSPRTVPLLCENLHDTTDANGRMNDHNATVLRGLAWLAPLAASGAALTRAIGKLAGSAYRKIRGVGPRAVKVGNAAVYALSEIGDEAAVGQLAVLRVKVRFGTAQKEIDKAYTAAAGRLNVPRDEIEEMGVPTYGLEEVGVRRETLGDYRAELVVTGSGAALTWSDAATGKALKSVPAKVKKEFKDELKDLQQSLKDIAAMLPAQRDRIDGLFLARKTWPLAVWRDRYLDHPLVGTVARRLIWRVDGVAALFVDGRPLDVDGRPVSCADSAKIELWHPIGVPVDEVTAWRGRLAERGITQPFKQAHREVYLLTDAERGTNTYSNRFAAHVIRQHQFNALCAARGWRNKLRLMVDDSYPPASRALPPYDLRAEFWIEGIGENYGADTTESGAFRHLSTDQVRFYPLAAPENSTHAFGGGYTQHGRAAEGAAPLPLDRVPPLVLSEIFRDVDLFVGVCSVGNDPTWQDGGPEQRYRQYWQSYSFGDLTESAKTRRAVLETLVPRLKIRDRASLADRFLVVRGNLRTYKIHLGSGNILMDPNDQYLCIVPDQSMRGAAGGGNGNLFLPFEGDNTLALILSKAFLLAADDEISDPTITRQIKGS